MAERSAPTSPYLNERSAKFAVDGKAIPLVPFDAGESYAGLLPISDRANETRKLFFWFFPSPAAQASDEIVVWLNGGPGCSSLGGMLSENGPFLWQPGTLSVVKNAYAWSNLANTVWVDQPVGTGFSQGEPDIRNEVELAEQFKGFWRNFVDTFGLAHRRVYLAGESYAGMYVPYIADGFLEANDAKYFNVSASPSTTPSSAPWACRPSCPPSRTSPTGPARWGSTAPPSRSSGSRPTRTAAPSTPTGTLPSRRPRTPSRRRRATRRSSTSPESSSSPPTRASTPTTS